MKKHHKIKKQKRAEKRANAPSCCSPFRAAVLLRAYRALRAFSFFALIVLSVAVVPQHVQAHHVIAVANNSLSTATVPQEDTINFNTTATFTAPDLLETIKNTII